MRNDLTLNQRFESAGTGERAQVYAPNLLVQATPGITVTIEGTNFPEVSGSWQPIGTHSTGYTPTSLSTSYASIRVSVDGAGEVSISGAHAATGAGGGGGGGGAVTVANGADVAQGNTADAAVAAGAAGTVSAKLRAISRDIGAFLARLPAALGPQTAANSLSVTSSTVAAASVEARVAASATSTQVLAANPARRRVVIVNDSPSATLRLRFSATAASVNAFTYLLNPGDTYESPTGEVYTGAIQGIWSAAAGAAQVTEF